MENQYPFDKTNGLEGTSGPWINANRLEGIHGSTPSATFYDRVSLELVNAIESAALIPSNNDLTQLAQAIIKHSRFTTNTDLIVGPNQQFETIPEALVYVSRRKIPLDTIVRLLLTAGDHEITTETGPAIVDHPEGTRIVIEGPSLTGPFPDKTAVNLADKSTVEANLRNVFPAIIQVTGQTNGVFVRSGTMGLLRNVAIIGDGSPGQHGIMVGEWDHGHGRGGGKMENVFAFNCGEDGIRSNYNSEIVARNLGATHNGKMGFRAANQSGIQCAGRSIACRNGNTGFFAVNQGFIEVFDDSTGCNNGNFGYSAFGAAHIAFSCALLDIRSNGGATANVGTGIMCADMSYVRSPIGSGVSIQKGGNIYDLQALSGGYIVAGYPMLPGATSSPAPNVQAYDRSFILA
jgi:hypothetical protein